MLSPHYEIRLSLEERQRIETMLRSGKTEQRMAKRAAIILLADAGLNNQQIADQIGTARNLVQKWRKRFAEFESPPPPAEEKSHALVRLDGLLDLPRSGRPPVFSPSGAAYRRGRGVSGR